jgi:maltokinase
MARADSLAAGIANWLPKARWFAGKGRPLDGVAIADAAAIADTDLVLSLVDATSGGERVRYAVPVRRTEGRDAAVTAEFAAWLVDTVVEGRVVTGREGQLVGQPVAGGRAPSGPTSVAILGGDASNTSLVARRPGVALALKLLRRAEAGIQPEVEVGAFLSGRLGWSRTPPLVGWLEYQPTAGGEATVLATVHEFLPDCRTAWEVLGEELAAGRRERVVGLAAAIGTLSGEMHARLASRADLSAFAPEPERDADRRLAAGMMTDHVERALARAAAGSVGLAAAVAERLVAVAAQGDRLAAACGEVSQVAGGERIRVHGDYHLGQVLVRGDGEVFVIDFEGEPARPLVQRRAKASPFKDVAGMCRSFDYLLRQPAGPAAGGESRNFPRDLAAVEGAFLAAYRQEAAGHAWWPADPAAAARLLEAWKIDKAVYELAYEIDNRPAWVEVPLAALESYLARA